MPITRRKFIHGTVAAGSFFIIPRHVLGRGFIAPSDKLNIAAIGAGGKGGSDIFNAYNNGANNVIALCDVDKVQATGSIGKFPNAAFYQDYRIMLEKEKGIDAVTISIPDHNHAAAAMAAMQLGKHVYVQKPLTHDIFEARQMTAAARAQKVVTQMGNQGASGAGTKQFVDWYNQGLIGTVSEAHIWTNRPVWPQGIPTPKGKFDVPKDLNWDAWLGTSNSNLDYNPGYHPFKWRGWWEFGTGALGDMGCHLIDTPFRSLGLGYPTEVECSAGAVFTKDWTPEYIPEGCPPSSQVKLKFKATEKNKSDVTMYWSDGGIRPFHPDLIPADDFMGDDDGSNGVIMIGEKGILMCGTYGNNPRIYYKDGTKQVMPKIINAVNLPDNGHQIFWTDACKAGFNSAEHKALTSSFDYAGPLTETILMGNLAIRSYTYRTPRAGNNGFDYPGRKKLLWDGNNMKITNFAPANDFVKREYRRGW